MPRVTRDVVLRVVSNAVLQTSKNPDSSKIKWSEGATTTEACGSRRAMTALAYAMQGAVFRMNGSQRMFSSGMAGKWAATCARYRALVTTRMRSAGTNFSNRSNVMRINERPVPRMSKNCLGSALRDMGQNLDPMPPAMMTA